jgi:hypothetical protein
MKRFEKILSNPKLESFFNAHARTVASRGKEYKVGMKFAIIPYVGIKDEGGRRLAGPLELHQRDLTVTTINDRCKISQESSSE